MSGSSTEPLDGLRFKYIIRDPHATIVKEGWLQKRGEHIKSWRPRYFVLRLDGSLVGYREDPTQQECAVVWNYFKVRDCQVINSDRRKPYTFRISGLNFCSSIVRTFATETGDDRQEWVNALKLVVNHLNSLYGRNHSIGDDKNDTRAAEVQLSQQLSLLKTSTVNKDNAIYKATLENFDLLQVLGQGSYGKVVLCREKSTNELYAIKMIRKDLIIKRDEVDHVLSENNVLRSTEHPFLVSLKYSFQTNDRLYYVTEFVNGGDIFFHLKRFGSFPETRTRFYGAEIISAVGYLHSLGIIYRDLKAENILLDREGHIKIVDFGLCKQNIYYGQGTNTFCGTPEYLAPEVIQNVDYGLAVDWWCTGIVLYEMMSGKLPFYSPDVDVLFQLIQNEPVKLPSCIFSEEMKSLLSGLLHKKPDQRLGGGHLDVKEIMYHPFFADINWSDLVQKKIPPSFKPQLESETDTCYFDEDYTKASVKLTPTDSNHLYGATATESLFPDFSYQDANNLQ